MTKQTIKRVNKIWGYEECIINTPQYCGKILTLIPGFISSYHHHKKKDETFYVLEGKIYLRLGKRKRIMSSRDTQRVLPGQKHEFASLDGISKMVEFSTNHRDDDSYRDTNSRAIDISKLKQKFRI